MAAMRRGNFEEAWRISDVHLHGRLADGLPFHVGPRHLQPVWDGSTLAGKRVLVRCYHGLGDTVQFVRFAGPLRRIARHVTVWAQPALLDAVRGAAGVDQAFPLHDGTPQVRYDVDIEIMELAHALRVDRRTIRVPVPYLFKQHRPAIMRSRRYIDVGVVWQAGDWVPERSIAPSLLTPVAQLPGIRLLSLQRGPAACLASTIPARPIGCDDVRKTAILLRNLDLLITVDTFIAHLAGAIGVPVWLLLHADCDWRWMDNGSNTVWYPTMRIFRQPRSGDWRSVIDDVIASVRSERVGYNTFGTNTSV
jgi:hypothetical protein